MLSCGLWLVACGGRSGDAPVRLSADVINAVEPAPPAASSSAPMVGGVPSVPRAARTCPAPHAPGQGTFSPNGKWLATAVGGDDHVAVWDLTRGAVTHALPTIGDPSGWDGPTWLANGRLMTVGFGRWPERHFQLWEAETFGEVLAFPFACDTFWFDKPLARMAAQSCYGEIVVYDLATRQKIERPISDLEHGGGEAGGMTSFLATGGLFVMDSQDGPQVLDEHTLVRRRRVPMREKLSAAVTAVSPAEAFAAVWDYEMLGVYRLPSLTKERSQALPHHEPFTAWQITWLDDKRLLLASQREGQVLVASIDPAGGLRALRRDAAPRGDGAPDGSEGCAADAAFEPVTRAIAVTDSDCSVRVLDAESFAERAHITAPEPPGPAGPLLARTHFSPAGSHLTLSSANTLAVLTASGRVVARVDAAQTSEHFSPDGRFVAVPRKHTLRIVRTADGEFVDVEMFGSGAAARGVVSTARAFQGPPELEACTAHARPDGARQERPTLLADFAAGRALP